MGSQSRFHLVQHLRFYNMSDLKVDGITASTGTNTNIAITGKGSGKVALGDGTLLFPDADGSANQYIKTDGSGNLAFATLPTSGFTSLTQQATTSGTAFDFTIPSGATQICMNLDGVSLNGTNELYVQLGDAGGIETSGYVSIAGRIGVGGYTATAAMIIKDASAASITTGPIIWTLVDSTTNKWAGMGSFKETYSQLVQSQKSLSAELTTIRLTKSGGNTFDAGAVNCSYF